MPNQRPPFIVNVNEVPEKAGRYPDSEETLSFGRAIGRAAGLMRIGLHLERLPPGHRTSWPHAEEGEEEFVFVLEGDVEAWIDGDVYPLRAGDLAAFPANTGIAHAVLNNSKEDALLFVGGENKPDTRIFYPLHPERRGQMPWSRWWEMCPQRPIGTHDGMTDALREAANKPPDEPPHE